MTRKEFHARTRRSIGRNELKAWQSPPRGESVNSLQPNTQQAAPTRFPGTSCLRQFRIEVNLLETINNAVNSAMTGGNFQHCSQSDFIRDALHDYRNGMQLLVPVQPGQRRSFTLRLNEETKNFWDSLPTRARADILDRVLRTKMMSSKIGSRPLASPYCPV